MSRRSQQHFKALLQYGGRWPYDAANPPPKGSAMGTYKGFRRADAEQHVGKMFPQQGRKTQAKVLRVVRQFS